MKLDRPLDQTNRGAPLLNTLKSLFTFVSITCCLIQCTPSSPPEASRLPEASAQKETENAGLSRLNEQEISELNLTPLSELRLTFGKSLYWFVGALEGEDSCLSSRRCTQRGECIQASLREAADKEIIDRRCVAKNRNDCLKSSLCQRQGQCTPKAGRCQIQSDLDCFQSSRCSLYGACALQGDECVAKTPEHCTKSASCRNFNACHLKNNLCVNSEDALPQCKYGCIRSFSGCFCHPDPPVIKKLPAISPVCLLSCETDGACDLGDQGCKPSKLEHCTSSQRCLMNGVCGFEDGRCVPTSRGCASSLACSLVGRCTLIDGQCEATSIDDCEASRICAELEACQFESNTPSTQSEVPPQPVVETLTQDPQATSPIQGRCVRLSSGTDCSQLCSRVGQCEAVGERCLATSDQRCRRSQICQRYGQCTAYKGQCLARSKKDCQQGENCTRFGYCTPNNGRCLKN